MYPVHPPKIESFDLRARTNVDPKGYVRPVQTYREEPFGLYMSRAMVGHPRCDWVESWLLPALGLRVTDWWWSPGLERDQDYYLDIVDVERGPVWRTTDHYIDLVVRSGAWTEVLDTDEFVAAVRLGLLDAATAERALRATHRALAGICRHGHDLDAWLSEFGIRLAWQRR
jgi:predicted RNA-binding protein associated with RNAse of E/G family